MARSGVASFAVYLLLSPAAWAMQQQRTAAPDAEVRDGAPTAAREPVDRERVIALLDNPRTAPTTANLRNLGGGVDGLLIQLAQQNDMSPRVRSRADAPRRRERKCAR